jgi:hypothetical protein
MLSHICHQSFSLYHLGIRDDAGLRSFARSISFEMMGRVVSVVGLVIVASKAGSEETVQDFASSLLDDDENAELDPGESQRTPMSTWVHSNVSEKCCDIAMK